MSEREKRIDSLLKTVNDERARRKLDKRMPREFFELLSDEDLRDFEARLKANPRDEHGNLIGPWDVLRKPGS